jgi:adenylate cyclase
VNDAREPGDTPATEAVVAEARAMAEEIETAILGSPRTLNRVEVTDAADVPIDRATALWRALGFPAPADDSQVMFNEGDIEALRLADWLQEAGVLTPDVELTLVRSLGRGFARLAEWEISELAATMLGETEEPTEEIKDLVASLLPVLEDLQTYVWRRHLAQAAGRLLLRPLETDNAEAQVVGFADIVGFTRRSRDLSAAELGALVDTFEAHSFDIVTEHGGRVIKTIGDEILFVADRPEEGARIALALTEAEDLHDGFPTLRVGLAYGPVLSRVGDVFGPVVNIASRLTSLARPGRILIERELRGALRGYEEEFRVRRSRTTAVRGYARLDTWALRRPDSRKTREPSPATDGIGVDTAQEHGGPLTIGQMLR